MRDKVDTLSRPNAPVLPERNRDVEDETTAVARMGTRHENNLPTSGLATERNAEISQGRSVSAGGDGAGNEAARTVNAAPVLPQSSIDRMVHDFPILNAFHEKHGMPMMTQASCFKCGQIGGRAITHAELPNIYICKDCCAAPVLQGEREAFEAWAHEHGFDVAKRTDGSYFNVNTACVWEAWQARASRAQEQKPGYVLVPVEPTVEMVSALMDYMMTAPPDADDARVIVLALAHAIAAAPSADKEKP